MLRLEWALLANSSPVQSEMGREEMEENRAACWSHDTCPPPTHALTPLQIALLICWANWWWVAKLEIPTEGKFSLQNIAWEWELEDFRSGPQETQPTAFGKEQGMPHGMTYKIGFEQSFLCGGHKHGKVGQATFTLFIPLIRPLSLLFSLPSLRPLQFLASHPGPFRGNSQVA